MPVIFPYNKVSTNSLLGLNYAYYSQDGLNFDPLRPTINGVKYSHDTSIWPFFHNEEPIGRVVMFSNIPDAVINKDKGIAIALYSRYLTTIGASRRQGNGAVLSLLALYGHYNGTSMISTNDSTWHTMRCILAVGNLNGIRACIETAKAKINDWGNWFNK